MTDATEAPASKPTKKTGQVFLFPGASPEVLNISMPGDQVLEQAIGKGLTNVLVLGYMPNGDIFLASSSGDVPKDHFLLVRASTKLVDSEFSNSAFDEPEGEMSEADPRFDEDGDDCA